MKPTDTKASPAGSAAVPVSLTCQAIDRRRGPALHWFTIQGGRVLVAISDTARKEAAASKLQWPLQGADWSHEHRLTPSDLARVRRLVTTVTKAPVPSAITAKPHREASAHTDPGRQEVHTGGNRQTARAPDQAHTCPGNSHPGPYPHWTLMDLKSILV